MQCGSLVIDTMLFSGPRREKTTKKAVTSLGHFTSPGVFRVEVPGLVQNANGSHGLTFLFYLIPKPIPNHVRLGFYSTARRFLEIWGPNQKR